MNGAVEHASSKGAGDENFPVASLLIARRLRPHARAFYRFARNADDIADAPDLSPEEKLRRLDRMAAALDGEGSGDAPSAEAMRESLAACGVNAVHCQELLAAFRQDAVKSRYADWDELMGYCRLSAAPVGRYLLDLHGEDRASWPASDALCAALQVINHLQDCAQDFRRLDRVYLPLAWFATEGIDVTALAAPKAAPELRRVLDRTVAATEPLVERARALPRAIRSAGLRREAKVIVALAARLLGMLARRDPLAGRVALGPVGSLRTALGALVRGMGGGR